MEMLPTQCVVLLSLVLVSGTLGQDRVFKMKGRTTGCGPERCHPTVPGLINVHLVPHSHDDTGWLKTVDQYYYGDKNEVQRAGVQYILESVIKELAMDPSKKFIQVETGFLWRWWKDKDEFMRNLTITLVNAGQLEFAGGGWSMNDEACTHYTSIIDNMEFGLNWLRDNLGSCAVPSIAWQIDPFGHSKEQARLFAEMGFDGLFFARIDYRDKIARMKSKQLQMIWEGAEEGDRTKSIFTGVFDTHYSAPVGFCWDVLCTDEPINDYPNLEEYNLDQKLKDFTDYVHTHSVYYKNTEHIMFTMGDDFHFQNARMNYKNMDKLIKYMNQRSNETGINVLYSTPSCYLKSLREGNEAYPVKNDDFFPYASSEGVYWTGYFSSRPSIKLQERQGARDLTVCRQMEVAGPKLRTHAGFHMHRAMGLMQHHDAVTGTEKQNVAEDYSKRLYKARLACQDQNMEAIREASGLLEALPDLSQTLCPNLNMSDCSVSETNDHFVVVVYNPLSWPISPFVRIPVQSAGYTVNTADGRQLTTQVNTIPNHIRNLPGRNSSAVVEIIFQLFDVPAMGYTTVYISKDNAANNKVSEVVFSSPGEGGHIVGFGADSFINISMSYYQAAGPSSSRRNSGAYVFSPDKTGKHSLGDLQSYDLLGDLVNETILEFGDWGVLSTREYVGMDYMEVFWQAGPIPVEDKIGKEVVVTYSSNITTNGIFFTDANGRQMIQRERKNTDSEGDIFESRNYYPVNARIELRGDDGSMMSVLTDRSEGGASLTEGQLELMVHRRLLHDDYFGVGEALNEEAFGTGLVANGRHWLVLAQSLSQRRQLMQELVLTPQISVIPTPWTLQTWLGATIQDYSALVEPLPPSVQVLTLAAKGENELILRFQHIMEKTEDEEPVTFDVQNLFTEFTVVTLTEMTLAADRPLSESKYRMENREAASGTLVELVPGEINTFIANIQWN